MRESQINLLSTAKILRHIHSQSAATRYIYMHRRNKLSRRETPGNFGLPKNPRDTKESEEDGERERKKKKKKSGGRRYQRRKCNERARANLYQPPEARGRRYGSRTTPDISDG